VILRGIACALGLGLLALSLLAGWFYRQGLQPEEWQQYSGAEIVFDATAIATVQADNWPALYEAQGFVVAAERLWQMDLMRRKASGRLSQWFGAAALPSDRRRHDEDWVGVAEAAYAALPKLHKTYLDAYTRGVNRFIQAYPHRWGIEYDLLGVTPTPWEAKDSLLIVLEMAETLTRMDHLEALQSVWRAHLTPAWQAYLFPTEHPWNKPYFGQASKTLLPPKSEWIPSTQKPLDTQATSRVNISPYTVGSNEWAWRGQAQYFLANDPHLSISVPNIWYAIRLRKGPDDWHVGVTIPGIPDIVLGMNQSIAWAFTNTHEDVDDLFEEVLNAEKTHYQDTDEQGQHVWRAIDKRQVAIAVKGQADDIRETWFTHRGPLRQRQYLGEAYFSRAWLPLKPGMLNIPTFELTRATDWPSFNRALDHIKVPAQHIMMMDRAGNIGYRPAGVGILRKVTGNQPQMGARFDWLGVQQGEDRVRIWAPVGSERYWLATANQRVWDEPFMHGYAGDERVDRIGAVLSQTKPFQREDMQQLQLDTVSRFHRRVLAWLAEQVTAKNDAERLLLARWQAWGGDAQADPVTFAQAQFVAESVLQRLLERARVAFLPTDKRNTPYAWRVGNALLLTTLNEAEGLHVFGLEPKILSREIMAQIQKHDFSEGYQKQNRWQAQHPFVHQVPVLGKLFEVPAKNQVGNRWVVRAESSKFGPSVRLVWDLKNINNSAWSLPIGQSGHVGSGHFSDFQSRWYAGEYWPVLDDRYVW